MNLKNKKYTAAVVFALLAASFYAISSPISKILLRGIPPTFLASLLYLGAGTGMAIIELFTYNARDVKGADRFGKKDLPYIGGMIMLDIAAPILLMLGLSSASAENVSLLNNFEIVATSVIALVIFREKISGKLWAAIAFITASSFILSFENINFISFSKGSLFVIAACICWGFENNCTRALSSKDPLWIVVIKGFGSGFGSLVIALAAGETSSELQYIIGALVTGFIAYGMSIYFYISAQRTLGAAKTSAFYAVAPFIGVIVSLIIFRDIPKPSFFVALALMIIGTVLAAKDAGGQK